MSDESDEPDSPQGVAIQVQHAVEGEAELSRTLIDWLEGNLRRAAGLLGERRVALSVVLVDDEHMTRLHDQFMQMPETTDVLTFDLRDDPAAPIEGEVYVCVDEARRRAAEPGHRLDHELLLYALHGLLHLVGYDDREEAAWRQMHAKEDELLEALGVGRVFDVQGGGESG